MIPETKIGKWYYNIENKQLGKVIETHTLWGNTFYRVWLPDQDKVIQVTESQLKPLSEADFAFSSSKICYLAAACRIVDSLNRDMILAPVEASVIPLPHQIYTLSRAISGSRVRYLLADEVGLGKTIEAGLIMRELKLRGLIKRILIVVPTGLVNQWITEMKTHFNEDFHLLIPSDFSAYQRITQKDDIWQVFDQVICPMDSVKPLDSRKGWDKENVREYNRQRFEALISANWDLIIADEAHRLGGSSQQVARHKLGKGLSDAAPYLLLLTGTPHQGKTDAFHRLVSLLDKDAFPEPENLTKEQVKPYVIRNEKRKAIDIEGKPLFKPRKTQLSPVAWEAKHSRQRRLYQAVTDYVRLGYNQAMIEKRNYLGFLMLLMQRLVASSSRAIRTSLEKRLEVLELPEEQLTLFPTILEEEWADMDGQEQLDILLGARLKALKNEREEVKLLLQAARHCEESGPDPKAEALLNLIYRLQQEEGDPEIKILVFTEFVPTQQMLDKFLTDRGFKVVCLNGSMNLEEREAAQKKFLKEARVLVSTDAGGEGLNLQFCHVVINYDMPWNPMKLEQRIGRVDRIGQNYSVRAINFILEDSVEYRVQEVLEEKLAVIFREFGVDKTADVLDSAQAGQIFDNLYVEAILHPEELDNKVEKFMENIRQEVKDRQENISILGSTEEFKPEDARRLMSHPFAHWAERATVNFIEAFGGKTKKSGGGWELSWPDGEVIQNAVFSTQDKPQELNSRLLTLEDLRQKGIFANLSRFIPGQPIPVITLPNLSRDLKGYWSLWRIGIHRENWNCQRIMPIFLHDDGRCLIPTANLIWEQLLAVSPVIHKLLDSEKSASIFAQITAPAEKQGETIYQELGQKNNRRVVREKEKLEYSNAVRRKAIERIGLPAVRSHRLADLEKEEQLNREKLEQELQINPELVPLLILRVEGNNSNE